MKRIVIFCLMGIFLAGPIWAQADRSEEIKVLTNALDSTSRVQRVNAAKVISRSGFVNEQLYERVAGLLQAGYLSEYEKDLSDEMSWMCKALAASGDTKYKPLLEEVVNKSPSVKIQRYAQQSLELMDQYASRRDILNSTEGWDNSLSSESNRLINMLTSDNVSLRRDAAKIITRQLGADSAVVEIAAETLLDMAKEPHADSLSVDTMAWLCKALAASGDTKYLDVLSKVQEVNTSSKLRSYAAKSMKALQ